MTMNTSGQSAEQQARDLLERCGVEDAQSFTAGDVAELANLIADDKERRRQLAVIRDRCVNFTPDPSVVDEILGILDGDLSLCRTPEWVRRCVQ